MTNVSENDASRVPTPEEAEAELAVLSAHIYAATQRRLYLIRLLEQSGRWHEQGAKSCAHWLSWRVGMDLGAAREHVRVAKALAVLPAVDESLRDGRVSYSQVRAMTRVATPDNEARLLEMAQHSTAAQLEKICRGVRLNQEKVREPTLERFVRLRHRGDGTAAIELVGLADEAELVFEAIRTVHERMCQDLDPKPDRVDALVRIAQTCLADGLGAADPRNERELPAETSEPELAAGQGTEPGNVVDPLVAPALCAERSQAVPADAELASARACEPAPPSARAKPVRSHTGGDFSQLIVHLAPGVLDEGYAATLDDGTRVSAETFRRIACDCSLLAASKDGRGSLLDIGRKSRKIPPAISRALDLRDGGCCAFPGCTHRRFRQRHHLLHWLDGGETKLANLLTLCSFHHRLVHELGWRVSFDAPGKATFCRPEGTLVPAVPAPAHAPPDPLAAFELAHEDRAIDEETCLSDWDGTRPDYDMCIAVACGGQEDDAELDRPASEWLSENGYLAADGS